MSSVLFVGVGAPWVGGAGYLVRQRMLLGALMQAADDVRLAMFDCGQAAPPADWRVTPLPGPTRPDESRWLARLQDVFSPAPLNLRALDCTFARAAVRALQPHRFDAVVAYRCDFAHMAGVLRHRNVILDIDDPEHLRRAQAIASVDDGNPLWLRRLDVRRLRRFEIDCARQSRARLVCQPRDAEPFRAAGLEPIIVPNCVEVPRRCPSYDSAGPAVLLVANLAGARTSPNVDGLLWFLRDVWPALRRLEPECEFRIAGEIAPAWREQASRGDGVRVLGFVNDLQAEFDRAAVSIAPIRFGTGTRIKILESMAGGCPVVSTTKGCEGLEVIDQRDILVADEAQSFAAACSNVLRDAALGQRLGEAGWRLVLAEYDRSRREQWLASVLRSLIESGAAVTRRVA